MRRRDGFTLVELMATTALATLLMLVVLAVLPSLRRVPASVGDGGQEDVLRLLQRDLIDARRMQSTDNGVTLWGYCLLNPTTLSPLHQPASVSYRIEAFAGRPSLLRFQTGDDGKRDCELIAADVTAFYVVAMQRDPPTAQGPGDEFQQGDGEPMARSVRVRMSDARGVADQVLWLR